MTTEAKRSPLKLLLKILVIILVLLIVLVALAPTLLSGFIKDAVVENAEAKLDGRLEVADFSFGWTSGLEMKGLKLVRSGRSDAALEIDSMTAEPDIMAAISGRYTVDKVALTGVTLRVRRDEDGVDWSHVMKSDEPKKPKVPAAKKKTEGPGTNDGAKKPETKPEESGGGTAMPEFLLAGQISGLRVIYDDVALGAPIEFADLKIDFSAGRDEGMKVTLAGPEGLAADLSATLFRDGKLLASSEMRAEGKLALPRAELARFAAGLESLLRVKSGRLALDQRFVYAGGALDLKGKVDIDNLDVEQDGKNLGLGVGALQNDLVFGSQGLSGTVDLHLARTRVAGLPRQIEALDFDDIEFKIAMPDAESLRVESGKIVMPAGRVDVSGELRSDNSSGIALKGDLDLAPLARAFEGLPGLEGRITLNGQALREGENYRLRGQQKIVGLTARDLPAGSPTIRNESLTLSHDLTMTPESWDLARIDLESAFANLHLEGLRYYIADTRLENFGKKESPLAGSLDLDRLGALLGDMMPLKLRGRADLAARTKSSGAVESATVDLIVDSLVMSGGALGDQTITPGRTRIGFELSDIARGAESPMTLNAKSALFDLRGAVALAADPAAAFGRTGSLTLAGNAQLDQLLAPFFAAAQYGKTDIDLALALDPKGIKFDRLKLLDRALALEGTGRLVRTADREDLSLDLKNGHYLAASGSSVDFGSLVLASQRGLTDDKFNADLRIGKLVTKSADPAARAVAAGDLGMKAAGTFDAVNKAANVVISEFRAGGADLTGALDWSQGGGLGRLKLDGTIDWEALSSRFLTLIDPAARGKGSAPVAVDLRSADGTPARTSGRVDLKIPALFIEGFDLSNLELAAAMTDGKGKIEKGSAALNGGTVELGGDIDLTLPETQFGSNFKAQDVRLVQEWQPAVARVIPIFGGVGVSFSGLMDADVDLRGQGATWDVISKALNGQGDIALREGKVESSPMLDAFGLALGFSPDLAINDLASKFQVKNGGVYQDNLEIKTGVVDLRFSGTTYLDGKLDYTVGLKPVSREPARWQQFAALVASDGYLPLALGGTVDSPSPKLPSPETLLKKSAEGLIQKGLGDLLNNKKDGADGNATGGEKKPEAPLGGLIDLFGGKKDKKKDDKKN